MFIPVWIKNYQRSDFKPDLLAGLTVGVFLIPQGMAYAMIAGLPPIYGLYASTVPLIIYALFGTSRQMSVAPVAMDSLLTASGVSLIAQTGSEDYIAAAITLAMCVGVIQFSLGVSRLGFLINFLSHPVIQGFTSAAAFIIAVSQLKHLLGINLPGREHIHDIVHFLIQEISNTHFVTLFIGLTGIAFLIIMRKLLSPSIPGPLILVAISIIIVRVFHLEEYGVKIIGHVPLGLPAPSIPSLNISLLGQLMPIAFALAMVGFMESSAVAKSIKSGKFTNKVIPNKELMALGMANMAGSVFRSFPVSGGLSRTVINDQAGAKSGMSSIVSAILVILTLLFLTPLFHYLPFCILASVIIIAVYRLINVKEAKRLWYVDRKDFLMMLVTFIGTLFFGIITGIGIGILLSLAWIIFEASYPHHAELGRITGTQSFRNTRRFNDLVIEDDILIFRFDAPLFFANIERFRDVLREYKVNRKDKIKAIVIDMESNNTVDSSALVVLSEMIDEMNKDDIQLYLTDVKGPVRDKFYKSGLTQKLGESHFFISVEDALNHIGGRKIDLDPNISLQANK